MATQVTTEKIAVNFKLNNGTTTTGQVKTVSVSLGKMDKDHFDADKIAAIATVIAPCFTKSVYKVHKVETSAISPE